MDKFLTKKEGIVFNKVLANLKGSCLIGHKAIKYWPIHKSFVIN